MTIALLIGTSTELGECAAVLRTAEVRVIKSSGTEETLRLAYRHQPELIVADSGPLRAASWELLKFLRELSTDMPIFVVDSGSDPEDAADAFRIGVTKWFTLPADASTLASSLLTVLAST